MAERAFTADIDSLFESIGEAAEANGWRRDMPNKREKPAEFAAWVTSKLMLAVGELSEAVEEIRNGNDVSHIYYSEGGKPEGFPVEVADAIIRLGDLWHAVVRGEDEDGSIVMMEPSSVIHDKLIFNDSRGHRHGGKAI